jgi:hypothetical protein
MDSTFYMQEMYATMNFNPEISASKVAALIGLNPYQSPHEVMYDLLAKHLPTKIRMNKIESDEDRKPLSKVKNDILYTQAVKDLVANGIQACVGKTDISDVLGDVEKKAKMIIDLRHSELPPDVQELVAKEVRGAVQKRRGLNNENGILNTYQDEHKVEVKDRNTVTYRKVYDGWRLIGRTDGYVEEYKRIVDSKARTRWWPQVPLYDEIQMRVYMELSGAEEAELFEAFPDHRTRTTRYLNDPAKWKTIYTQLVETVGHMHSATVNEDVLRPIIFANTVVLK